MTEIWKPLILDDIQLRYAVSNKGRVFDLKLLKYLNINDNGAGYKTVAMMGPRSKLRLRYLHRLVAHVFLDNPDNLPQVGHKDHTRDNNVVDNLYWTTQKQNTQDGIKAGKINANRPKSNRTLTKEEICTIALLESEGYGVAEIAKKLGCHRTTISSVFNGRSNWELFSFAREEIASMKILQKTFDNP